MVCDVFSVRNELNQAVTQNVFYNLLFFIVPEFLYKFSAKFLLFSFQCNQVFNKQALLSDLVFFQLGIYFYQGNFLICHFSRNKI